jgi:hypothetical protein
LAFADQPHCGPGYRASAAITARMPIGRTVYDEFNPNASGDVKTTQGYSPLRRPWSVTPKASLRASRRRVGEFASKSLSSLVSPA